MKKFVPIPCGQTLPPNNVHAVSVSMPQMQNIIDYEKGTPEIFKQIKSGYPRFVLHPYLKQVAEFLARKYQIDDSQELVLISSKKAEKIICDKYFLKQETKFDESFGIICIDKKSNDLKKVLTFIQNSGCILSSRFAEDYLLQHSLISNKHKEEIESEANSLNIIRSTLAKGYLQPEENIGICTSGMNAVYSVLKTLKDIQSTKNRNLIVQLGWLYLDTMNIVENHWGRSKIFYDFNKLDLLIEFCKDNGDKIAAIITEVPSNPLIQTPNLDVLKSLGEEYDIPIVIDSTFATAYNLDLKTYSDIFIESLTKFACGHADILMGAIIINENSSLAKEKEQFFRYSEQAYIRDIQRLAYEIKDYQSRVEKINLNCLKLAEYLKTCKFVNQLFYSADSPNYLKLMRHEKAVGGVISISLNKDFQQAYNCLNFAKGPSLGTEFTLLMPYVYLAHYDLITNKEGRQILKDNNIPIDLLRISVGLEDINEIIAEFSKLDYM